MYTCTHPSTSTYIYSTTAYAHLNQHPQAHMHSTTPHIRKHTSISPHTHIHVHTPHICLLTPHTCTLHTMYVFPITSDQHMYTSTAHHTTCTLATAPQHRTNTAAISSWHQEEKPCLYSGCSLLSRCGWHTFHAQAAEPECRQSLLTDERRFREELLIRVQRDRSMSQVTHAQSTPLTWNAVKPELQETP